MIKRELAWEQECLDMCLKAIVCVKKFAEVEIKYRWRESDDEFDFLVEIIDVELVEETLPENSIAPYFINKSLFSCAKGKDRSRDPFLFILLENLNDEDRKVLEPLYARQKRIKEGTFDFACVLFGTETVDQNVNRFNLPWQESVWISGIGTLVDWIYYNGWEKIIAYLETTKKNGEK